MDAEFLQINVDEVQKSQADLLAAVEKTGKRKPLTEPERIYAAMVAAGRSPRVAEHLPEKHRKQIAALCSVEGVAVVGVRDKLIPILQAAGEENKATGLTEDKE